MTENELDIDKMVAETNISAYKIRCALDLPLSDIEELFATMLRRAATPAEIAKIILMVNPETAVGRHAVRKLINRSHTIGELIQICDNVPNDHSEIHRAHEKLVELSGNDSEDGDEQRERGAETEEGDEGDSRITELLKAFDIIPSFSAAEERLIVKLAKFFPDEENPGHVDVDRMVKATNVAESSIRFALKIPPSKDEQTVANLIAQCETPAALLKVFDVIQTWSVLGLQAVRQFITISNRNELIMLAAALPEKFPILSEVYAKLLACSTTRGEVLEIFRLIPPTRAADEDQAIKRLAEFFRKPKTDEPTTNP